MAYVYGDLITKLQSKVGDPNLDTSSAGDALNYAEQSIFNNFTLTLNSAQQSNSVNTGSNTLNTPLPSDYQRMSSLYVSSPVALARDITEDFVPVKRFRQLYPGAALNTGGFLDAWTMWSSIEFSAQASQTFTLTLDYVKAVPLMSVNTDVPTIPAAFEELLIIGAKIRVYEDKEDFDYAQTFQNRYADLLEAFTTRYSTSQVDYQVVVPSSRSRIGRPR